GIGTYIGKFLFLLLAAGLGAAIALFAAYQMGYLSSSANSGNNYVSEHMPGKSWDESVSVVSNIAEKVSPSVVGISNVGTVNSLFQGLQEVEMGTGSGVIFKEDGYIITNNHVIANANRLEVTLSDGRKLPAKLIGADARTDLAVIKVDAKNLSAAVLGDSDALKVGELAIAIGNPGGADFAGSTTVGFISGLNRLIQTPEGLQFRLIQTDAAINPGNSGGALVNSKGEVIGINSIKISANAFEGMGFAIPSNHVKRIVADLIQHHKVIRPALGVEMLYNVTPALAEANSLPVDYGVIVGVQPLGSAEKAGIQKYDIIIEVDGKKVEDSYDLQDIIFSKKIGDKVNVKVMREDKAMNFEVTLGELS
ncbi:MAG: trypsin-like peptidase domain-containing protein, partial [Clostridiales bacterium]